MIKLNLQFFGGRGSSAGKRTSSSQSSEALAGMKPTNTSKAGWKTILSAPEGSRIWVEKFSAITGKSTGNSEGYTLRDGVWQGRNDSFPNTPAGFATRNSKDGVVPGVRLVRSGPDDGWGIDQMNRRERAKAREESGTNMLKPGEQFAPGYGEMLAERVRRRRNKK